MSYAREGKWVQVPADVARRYVYYGVGGWLAVILVLMILGVAFLLLGLLSEVDQYGAAVDSASEEVRTAVLGRWGALGLQALWILLALALAFGKRRAFPGVMIAGLAVFGIGGMLLQLWALDASGARGDAVDSMEAGLVIGIIVQALFISYFVSSKRVNATYKHRLRADHPSAAQLLQPAAPVYAPPPAYAAPPQPAAYAPPPAQPAYAPPPPAAPRGSTEARLAEIKRLRDQGLIDEATYQAKQQDILRDV